MTDRRARVYLRQRKAGYTAIFYDPDRHPKQKYVTLRTRDKGAARSKLARLEERYARGLFDPWTEAAPEEGVTLDQAIERYLKSRVDVRPKTLRADRSTLELFARDAAPGALVQYIEPRHIQGFLNRDVSSATINTYHTRVKSFFKWCVANGLAKHNPVDPVAKPRLKRREKQFLTEKQYAKLLRTIEGDALVKSAGALPRTSLKEGEIRWLCDVVRFAVGTGLRLNEITSLRWNAVDLDSRLVTVRHRGNITTKSGHERCVPVAGEALEVLCSRNALRTSEADDYVFKGTSTRSRTKSKLNDEYVSKRFLRYVREAKLPDGLSFHSLRHTYISWMIMKGIPVPVIQQLAGHADIKTTMGYAHLAPDSLRVAVARVFGDAATGAVEERAL